MLLLLLFPFNSDAMDGCQNKDFWRCGDVCISADSWITRQDCNCGNTTFNVDAGKWCCASNCTGGSCLRWKRPGIERGGIKLVLQWLWKGTNSPDYCAECKSGDYCAEWSPVKCTNGVALNLTQSCNGTCNFFGGDKHRNYLTSRSYVAACSNNTSICTKEGEGKAIFGKEEYRPTICSGDPSCAGELDWCREEGRKNEECLGGDGTVDIKDTLPQKFTRCLRIGSNKDGGNQTKSIPGQCIEKSKARTGNETNCMDRSDEDPFEKATNSTGQETIIDFAKLKSCSRKGWIARKPGLQCGGQETDNFHTNQGCLDMKYWCKDKWSRECPVLGPGIRTNHPILCANITFWRELTCGKSDTTKIFVDGPDMMRCQAGKSGQCVDKENWGVEGEGCEDGSDLYRPINRASLHEIRKEVRDVYRPIKPPTEAEETVQQPLQIV